MKTVCPKHENGDPGSLACWGCEVERLRKLVIQLLATLEDSRALVNLLQGQIDK